MKKKLTLNNPAMQLIQSMQESAKKEELNRPFSPIAPSTPPLSKAKGVVPSSRLSYEYAERYADKPPTTRRATQGRETKSKRLNVLIRPSLHEALLELAEKKQTSVNDLINIGMQEYINRNL